MTDPPTPQSHPWYVLRDLKRPNAKNPAYKQLAEAGFSVFTPLTVRVVQQGARRVKVEVPFIPDLLFVRSDRQAELDHIIARTPTLQYRYVKGAPFGTPMTVSDLEMQRFIAAVTTLHTPVYYSPGDLTPSMLGARIRLVCDGPLNGFEGTLLKVRGSSRKRLLVQLPGILAAAVELDAVDYVELL